jgi:hypothetical protein
MIRTHILSSVVGALALGPLWVGVAFALSSEPKQGPSSEAAKILQDSKKNIPETPRDLAECMNQWGPQTQMTKEEWAASCRRTLHYFPESP